MMLETNTINQIPLDQRHGTPGDLFAIWFGANLMMLTIVTGALAPTIYHLTLLQSLLAVTLGNAIGGIFMALHAAQGPMLGVPQMVQTRGQFGSVGAVAVIAIVVLMYIGFVASNFVLAGDTMHLLIGAFSARSYIVVIAAITLGAAIYGHDLIHAATRAFAWIAGGALLFSFLWIAFIHTIPVASQRHGAYSNTGFLGALSVGALWQIAYAPYVSDYSRYLPPATGARPAFWASYAGCVAGSILPMALGATLAVIANTSDITTAFVATLGPASLVAVPIFSLGIAAASAMNIYCAMLSTITIVQTWAPQWQAGTVARMGIATCLNALSLALAIFAATNFMENYTNFILLLLYVLVPWTAINLVDFYLIRKGHYDVAAFFLPDGGQYGRYNAAALGCYIFGIAVQIPFVSNPLYTGPVAKLIGGADISWIVGLLLVAPLYWAIQRCSPAA